MHSVELKLVFETFWAGVIHRDLIREKTSGQPRKPTNPHQAARTATLERHNLTNSHGRIRSLSPLRGSFKDGK
jgi:hypothetical protein